METLRDTNIKDKRHLVLLKTQKLTAALYLVTEFLSDREPVRWQLRDRALSLLSDVAVFGYETAISKTDQLLSLIEVVINGGLASTMNFSILKKEYLNLKNLILVFQPDELALLKDIIPSSGLIAGQNSTTVSPRIPVPEKAKIVKNENDSVRRDTILAFIKGRGPVSIADIAKAVPAVSSKTVQRELNALIKQGVLTREGDRRWSRYQAISR